MSAEIPIRSSVETISNPFRSEREHRIMISQTRQEMQRAGRGIEELWSTFVAGDIGRIFQQAQYQSRIVQFKISDRTGEEAWYQAKFQYSGIDRRTQPVDVFHIMKEYPDKNDPPVKMAVATYKGVNSRYTQLVALETEEQDELVPEHFFYFEGNDLSIIRQSAQPQTFFHSDTDTRQFFQLNSKNISGEEIDFEVGLVGGDETTNHSYEYIGRGLVITNKLRIADPFAGRVELIAVSDGGIIEETAAFNLPQAVANIGKFQPAMVAA